MKNQKGRITQRIVSFETKAVFLRGDEPKNSVTFEEGQEVIVVSTDSARGTVSVLHPLDPARIVELSAEAVELYNEGLGIFQTVVSFFAAIGGFFKKIGSLFSKKK